MPLLRAFYTRAILTWGFMVRHKEASAAQPAHILPPPTTVVGAFAYPLLRLLEAGVSMQFQRSPGIINYPSNQDSYIEHRLITPLMKNLLESTKTASASLAGDVTSGRVIGLSVHQEIGKIITAPYRSGGSWEEARKTKLFTAEFYQSGITQAIAIQAVGATYGPGAFIELLWVFDLEKLGEQLGVNPEELDRIATKAAHGVVRIGSKEGLIAIDHEKTLYEKKVEVLEPGIVFKTRFYVEKTCVEPAERHLVNEVTMWGLTGKSTIYYVPSASGSNNILIPLLGDTAPHFRLLEPCKAYKLSNNAVGVGR